MVKDFKLVSLAAYLVFSCISEIFLVAVKQRWTGSVIRIVAIPGAVRMRCGKQCLAEVFLFCHACQRSRHLRRTITVVHLDYLQINLNFEIFFLSGKKLVPLNKKKWAYLIFS